MVATATDLNSSCLPDWVPPDARLYLAHTESGRSIRSLARDRGCHASTVLRLVRRVEMRRDDPLIDAVLKVLGTRISAPRPQISTKEKRSMNAPLRQHACIDDSLIEKEARRILRRMCETDATLVVSDLMPKAAVLRCNKGQQPTRTAVVERKLAQAFALKEWIACVETGKIARYEITPLGRAALKRMIARQPPGAEPALGQAEERNIYGDQHRDFAAAPQFAQAAHAHRPRADGAAPAREKPRQRYNLAESPLGVLSRRRDPKTGTSFLSAELVQAGERLREDFELAQMGARITQNWDKFMTAGCGGGVGAGDGGICEGPAAARGRVSDALADLGPGLGDILLRCCCFLEGLEAAEKRMGWSARSGKIVLRIALQQLAQHYAAPSSGARRTIG